MKTIPILLAISSIGVITFESMTQKNNYTTKVIAHRGAWKNTGATENSLAALRHAIDLGCYGSEFDVHMSADSVLFVLHDHSIQGVHIEKSTAAELFRIKLTNGEPLPTLESYLQAGKQARTRLILEIKTSQISKAQTLALTKKCVDMVAQQNVKDITDYISFSFDACLKVKQLDPAASVSYLTADKTPAEVADANLDGIDYSMTAFKKNENWLEEARRKKITSNVYTVNDKKTMQWFIDRKIDLITTNEPELLLTLLKEGK